MIQIHLPTTGEISCTKKGSASKAVSRPRSWSSFVWAYERCGGSVQATWLFGARCDIWVFRPDQARWYVCQQSHPSTFPSNWPCLAMSHVVAKSLGQSCRIQVADQIYCNKRFAMAELGNDKDLRRKLWWFPSFWWACSTWLLTCKSWWIETYRKVAIRWMCLWLSLWLVSALAHVSPKSCVYRLSTYDLISSDIWYLFGWPIEVFQLQHVWMKY